MTEHEQFMREAMRLSEESVTSGGGPFGALVVKDGEIVARGNNMVTINNDPTAHSEIVAIRNACTTLKSFQLEGCTIYSSTEPCPMCFGAIYWARPEKVYFATSREDAAHVHFDDSFIYKELELPLEERDIPFCQMLQEEGLTALKMWEDKKDKIEY